MLSIRAPSKINLYLEVLYKRDDGYHELVTVMAATTVEDRLKIWELPQPAGACEITCSDPTVPTDSGNLVHKAVTLVRRKTGVTQGVAIHIDKHIPVGAGMGGGSADCAATLIGLNQLFALHAAPQTLAEWAAELGSDIPFFFFGPVAVCRGRGERVQHLEVLQSIPLTVLYPNMNVSTAEVYRALNAEKAKRVGLTNEALTDRLFRINGEARFNPASLRNDLEAAARKRFPALEAVFQATADIACDRRMLTGSGSGIIFYSTLQQQTGIVAELRRRNIGTVIPARTLHSGESVFDIHQP